MCRGFCIEKSLVLTQCARPHAMRIPPAGPNCSTDRRGFFALQETVKATSILESKNNKKARLYDMTMRRAGLRRGVQQSMVHAQTGVSVSDFWAKECPSRADERRGIWYVHHQRGGCSIIVYQCRSTDLSSVRNVPEVGHRPNCPAVKGAFIAPSEKGVT